MAKTKISEYSATAANNTDVESVNIAEGCAPSGINNAIREVMSHLKDFQTGSAGDSLTVGGNFSVTGTVTIPDNAISGDKVEGGTINAITINTLSANPTLSAGTANGVTYLNGSKVLTSGSALTFDGTNLANTLSANASAGIRVTNSNAGTTTSTNTSYSNGTNSHEFGILGTGYTTYGVLAAGDAYIYAGANKNISLMADGVGAIKFGTGAGGPEQMRLTSTGLGIGTSSPDYKLDVNGTSNFSGNMNLTATSNINWNGGDVAISNSGTNLVFKTYSGSLAERARLDSSGNFGLGVTPSAWGSAFKVLQLANGTSLSNNGQTSYYQLGANNYFDGTDYKYIASNYAGFHRFSNVGAYEWHTAPSGTAGNAISFTQAMTLTAAGDLLVGTTSSSYSAANRTVLALGSGSDGFLIDFQVSGETSDGYIYADGTNFTIENSNSGYIRFNTDASERARIDASGHLIVPNGITLGTAVGTYADANTLDDYEEGTWSVTPGGFTEVLSGGTVTYSGTYTKIGRVIKFTVTIVTTGSATVASGNGGTSYFVLPFAPSVSDSGTWVNTYTRTTSGGVLVETNQYAYIADGWTAANANWSISGTFIV
jgi:hypothetical protein